MANSCVVINLVIDSSDISLLYSNVGIFPNFESSELGLYQVPLATN